MLICCMYTNELYAYLLTQERDYSLQVMETDKNFTIWRQSHACHGYTSDEACLCQWVWLTSVNKANDEEEHSHSEHEAKGANCKEDKTQLW